MLATLIIVYIISIAACLILSHQSEKIVYGEDTPNIALELIVGAVSFTPFVNTFVFFVLAYYYVKSKIENF